MRVLGPASDVWAQSGSSARSRRNTVSRLRLAENGPFCSHPLQSPSGLPPPPPMPQPASSSRHSPCEHSLAIKCPRKL